MTGQSGGDNAERELRDVRTTWEHLGATDPLWAVLTRPDKRGGRWDPAEFLATGQTEIASALEVAERHGLSQRRAVALDFGCGAGRLTRALAAHYELAIGIDVSKPMIDTAMQLNADVPNIRFITHDAADLAVVDSASVDFLYSRIVLQHMPSALGRAYIAEFIRVLGPTGLAMFQITHRRTNDPSWRRLARALRDAVQSSREMGMYGTPAEDVRAVVRASGGHVVAELPDDHSATGWQSTMFLVKRLP